MYRINESDLNEFKDKMLEQYLKDMTYELFNKYPLVKMGVEFSYAYKQVLMKYNFLNLNNIEQKNNIKFWMELFFIFGFDFLDKEEYVEIKDILNEVVEIGELSVSFKAYDILKEVCLNFDDNDLIINVLKGNFETENNFDNFKYIVFENFKNYYKFLDDKFFWLDFYNKNCQNYSLNEVVVKALNCDAQYVKIERILWQ